MVIGWCRLSFWVNVDYLAKWSRHFGRTYHIDTNTVGKTLPKQRSSKPIYKLQNNHNKGRISWYILLQHPLEIWGK